MIYNDPQAPLTFTNASIDSKTGKLKLRNAGDLYICAHTTDGRYFGSTYTKVTGPLVYMDASYDPITISKDLGIDKKGTYHLSLIPDQKAGYVNDNNLHSSLTLVIKKKQTPCEVDYDHLTLNDIPANTFGKLTATQEGI